MNNNSYAASLELSQCPEDRAPETYIIQLNRQVQYGAIEGYYIPCGGAVILHHAKTHGHRFNIGSERNPQKYESFKKACVSCVDLPYALLNLRITPGYIEEMISRQYSAITIGRQTV